MPSCDGTYEYCPVCKSETLTVSEEGGDYTFFCCLNCGYLKDQLFNLWDELDETMFGDFACE